MDLMTVQVFAVISGRLSPLKTTLAFFDDTGRAGVLIVEYDRDFMENSLWGRDPEKLFNGMYYYNLTGIGTPQCAAGLAYGQGANPEEAILTDAMAQFTYEKGDTSRSPASTTRIEPPEASPAKAGS
jgi:hypothetical protein